MRTQRKNSLHNRLIDIACANGWSRKGWKAAIRRTLTEPPLNLDCTKRLSEGGEILSIFEEMRYVPDAWRIRVEDDAEGWLHPVVVLEFLEVELARPVNDKKLRYYSGMWWALDSTEMLHLRVFRMDRFGFITPLVSEHTAFDLLQQLYVDSPLPEAEA